MAANYYNTARDPDMFDIRASLHNLYDSARQQRLLILLICLFTFGLVTLYLLIWPPVYSAEATLMVERDTDPVRDTFYTGWNVFRKDDARTEIELMTAGPVLTEVVEREKLTYDDVYHPFQSHLIYLWESSWIGKTYRGVKRALLPPELDAPSEQDVQLGRTVVDMRAGISIDPVAESNVGRLVVRGPSRKVAQVANTLVEVYLRRRSERYQTEAQMSYAILTQEASNAEAELQAAERHRLAFAAEHQLAFDFQRESLEVGHLAELEQNIATNRMRVAALEATLRELDKQLAGEPTVRTTATVYELNALREATKLKLLELQTALIQARNRYKEDSREVHEIKSDLTKLQTMVAESSETVAKATTQGQNSVRQELISKRNATRSELAGLRAGLLVMQQTALQMNARMKLVPALQDQLRALDRERTIAQEKFQQLVGKQAQAAVSLTTARATMPSMRVVERAVPPARKSWPKPLLLYAAALVMSLVIGLFAAVIVSYANGRIRREHILHGRAALPLYGTIEVATRRLPLTVLGRGNHVGSRLHDEERH